MTGEKESPSVDEPIKKEFRPETISFFSRWLVSNLTRSIGAQPSLLTARDKQIQRWMRRDAEAAEEADEEDNCSEENEKEEK